MSKFGLARRWRMASRFSCFAAFLCLFVLAACAETPQSVSGNSQATTQTNASSAATATTTARDTNAVKQKSEEVSGNNTLDTLVVYFDFDSSELTTNEVSKLSAGVQYFQAHPSLRLSIEGHADERGTREYNLALGAQRAATVADYLAAMGIDTLRTKQVSYGKEKPAVKGSTESAWRLNRRVEIVPER